MAAPNLNAPSSVLGKTWRLHATNTESDLIAAVATGHCIRVEAVYANNIHASATGWVTLGHKRSADTVYITTQLPESTTATFNLLGGRILYLEEGDSLVCQANASSNIDVVATGEDIS